jgi:hypothetical protein
MKNSSIGLSGILFVVFLVMKLSEIGQVANWSWWWVTSPLWIPLVIVVTILLFVFIIQLIMGWR